MKRNPAISIARVALAMVMMSIITLYSCSKKHDPKPTPPPFLADKATLITQPGQNKWSVITVTTTDNAGTVKTTTYTNPDYDPFYLVDAIFNADGTAAESDFGTDMSWTLTGNILAVQFGATGNDILHVTITKLDAHNMELEFNDHLNTFNKVVCVYTR